MVVITNKTKRFLRCFAFLIAFISFFACLMLSFVRKTEYGLIWLWPLSLTIFLLFNYRSASIVKNTHYVALSLCVFTQLIPRCAIYPFLVLLTSKDYSGVRHIALNSNDISKGIVIVFVEIISLALFVFLFELFSKKDTRESIARRDNNSHRLVGDKIVYVFFVIFASLLYLLIGRKMNVIQFASIKTGYSEINENALFTLVKYVVSLGVVLIGLLFFDREKRLYNKHGRKNIYFIIALLAGLFLTLVIVGESRGTQITIGIIVLFILVGDYPNKKITIFTTIFVAILTVVVSITIFRTNSNNIFDSSIDSLAEKLQVYYGGPESVAQNIKVLGEANINGTNLLFDFLRSCFPLNLVMKQYGNTVSQIYNLSIYDGLSTNGHIVFGASYGYSFFGILGIPLIICLNYFLSCKACEIFSSSNS